MKIQNLLLPKVGICTEEEMYFRREKNHEREIIFEEKTAQIRFDKFAQCTFDTYFNCLAIWKWKKYTTVGDVSLCLYLRGSFEITLTNSEFINGRVYTRIIDRQVIKCIERTLFTFPYKIYEYKGVLSFSLRSMESDSIYFGGYYDAQVEEEKLLPANIAINICTFKREPFILRNIDILRKNILNNPQNELSRHLCIYISDNGNSLPASKINDEHIRIVPNKNVGGAGGFSRGLMEIMAHSRDFPATHALMMDDDIVIEPESLFRTYTMLRCRKAAYTDMFIGGAMFRLDDTKIQVESGAFWNAGRLLPNKANINMLSLESCLFNEEEEYTEYNAWWYCCVPMSLINNDNLPLPIFIRGDDVEFGLRNMKNLVLLNGICVWHEAFENKYSSFLSYYILRNLLYDNALHAKNFGCLGLLMLLYRSTARELAYYRYKNVDLLFRGVNDFLKGIDFLKETDGEALHKEIMAMGYRAVPWEELTESGIFRLRDYLSSLTQGEGRWHRLARFVSLNGYLLPAKRTKARRIKIVSMAQCRPVNFFRQKRVLNYDSASKRAFITEKSLHKAVKALVRLAVVTVSILARYAKARADIRKNVVQVTNAAYWQKYLGL